MATKIFEFNNGPEMRYFLRGVEFASSNRVTKVTIKKRSTDEVVILEYEDDTTTRETDMAGSAHAGSNGGGDNT